MSTGGPDPNRTDDADREGARGELGDPASTRYGLSSGAILLIVLALTALVLGVALF